ncbi:hypothetical protein BGZ74_001394 [Mortierella antarctica]|nr:hypothetical protein BGZ74_001394 [Mortierella antarctica]
MKALKIAIPEAASSGGTITVKILVTPANSDAVRWLHQKLQTAFPDYVIPPLPEPLSEKLSEDVDQVEQKRVQIERFLQRICLRTEFATSEAVLWFVGTEMTHLDSVDSRRATLGFLRFDNIIKPSYDRGMRIYRPTENVEENDQGEFQRRQAYILSMEQSFIGLWDAGLRLTKERERDTYSQLGDATMEVLSSKHRLGDGQRIDNRERHQALDKEMQLFGVLSDDLRYLIRRQVKAETFQFMDMVQEYKGMLQGLKDVMNSRTDRLSDYVSASKKVAKRQIQVEQAIQKAATSPADLIDKAQLGLESANSKLESAREEFKKSQLVVTRELLRYEKDKAKEWQTTVQGYAAKQLMYEKEKLEALEKSWGLIQDLRFESEQRTEARTGGSASSGPKDHDARLKSYWPSGLGSPYAPELRKDDEEPRTIQEDLTSSPKQAMPEARITPETRFPPNYGSNSDYNSGYNSGPNSEYSSGYNSGDQDEGSRPGYFPATSLSRSGSGPRNKLSEPDLARKMSNSRKGSIAGMVSISAPTSNVTSTPLGPVDPVVPKEILTTEEDKSKDGYDPLMVRPGFTD